MTKHTHIPVDDATLPLPLDDADADLVKADSDISDLLDKNVLSICSPHVGPTKTTSGVKTKSALLEVQAKTRTSSKIQSAKNRIGKIMNKLYDLEPANQPEQPLNIDLDVDLYQMEDY